MMFDADTVARLDEETVLAKKGRFEASPVTLELADAKETITLTYPLGVIQRYLPMLEIQRTGGRGFARSDKLKLIFEAPLSAKNAATVLQWIRAYDRSLLVQSCFGSCLHPSIPTLNHEVDADEGSDVDSDAMNVLLYLQYFQVDHEMLYEPSLCFFIDDDDANRLEHIYDLFESVRVCKLYNVCILYKAYVALQTRDLPCWSDAFVDRVIAYALDANLPLLLYGNVNRMHYYVWKNWERETVRRLGSYLIEHRVVPRVWHPSMLLVHRANIPPAYDGLLKLSGSLVDKQPVSRFRYVSQIWWRIAKATTHVIDMHGWCLEVFFHVKEDDIDGTFDLNIKVHVVELPPAAQGLRMTFALARWRTTVPEVVWYEIDFEFIEVKVHNTAEKTFESSDYGWLLGSFERQAEDTENPLVWLTIDAHMNVS